MWVVLSIVLYGSKLMSNGHTEIAEMGRLFLSLSRLEVGLKYLVIANAGGRAVTQVSLIMLCAFFC